MRSSIYRVLAELVGKFSGDLTYYELQLLSPELAFNVMPLSVLAILLVVAVAPPVGHARFEFFDTPNSYWCGDVGVAVLVSVGAVRAAPAPASKASQPTPSVMAGVENAGSSG